MATSNRTWQNAVLVLSGTVLTVVIVACLYWAQAIFIPVAFAVFLTFLLTPLVTFLQRLRVPRVAAVLATLLVALLVLSGMVWLVTSQVTALAAHLPKYSQNIHAKVRVVTERLDRINRDVGRILGTPEGFDLPTEGAPTVVVTPQTPFLERVQAFLGPLAHGFAGGGLALVLTGFMLFKREDLRNRFIRLIGNGQITVATRALDEAAQRISRFLIAQVLINAFAGVSIGLGLLLLRVEYALLWGFLIFALRYVPYIGIWFATLPPVLLSFALSDGWAYPLLVATWIFVIEMLCANVLEPWLFGRSMGVSEVSFLVSAAFWGFLWGPIGMVLSSPLTVCLVVLSRYHPRLKFLDVLLGDEPALEPDLHLYQRLLARDQDEAADLLQERLTQSSPEQLLDELIVPALAYAKRDRARDDISDEDERFIVRAASELGEDLVERLAVPPPIPTGSIAGIADTDLPPRVHVLGCPAHDEEDETALRLLTSSLDPTRWDVVVLSSATLGSELVEQTGENNPDLVCIAALPPGGMAHTRYLCKRLRLRFPDVKIIIGRWGLKSSAEQNSEVLREAGADIVTTSLAETRAQLETWRSVLATDPSAETPHRERVTTTV